MIVFYILFGIIVFCIIWYFWGERQKKLRGWKSCKPQQTLNERLDNLIDEME